MRELWLYHSLSRLGLLDYRAKIMAAAVVATLVPLFSLAAWVALQGSQNWHGSTSGMVVVLVATVTGAGLVLFALHHLLRPVRLASSALRQYRETRELTPLPQGYSDEAGTLMADTAATLADLERKVEVLENFDVATGLPNRRRFLDATGDLIHRGSPFAVAVLRMTNHARIAGTLGPGSADAAMRAVGMRVRERVERPELVARISEAELAVPLFCREAAGDPWLDLSARLRLLLRACAGELEIDGAGATPVLHGGIAGWPQDAHTAEALLTDATAAASLAGEAAPVIMHSPGIRREVLQRFRLEQELRHAMDRGELSLHFQPIVDLRQGQTCGAEALLRWTHPQKGSVAPAVFVPVAEESGLIDRLGLWVLREACRQAGDWARAGRTGLPVAVNVSARQILDPDMKRHVVEALEDGGLAPDLLELEIGEAAATADHLHTRLAALRDIGVRLALDDFGTGHASIRHLRQLPFHRLKIDREFVRELDDRAESRAICESVLALGRGLGLEVLAEGPESEREVRCLESLGCHLFQGFYFGKPQPASAFTELLDDLKLSDRLQPRPQDAGASRAAG